MEKGLALGREGKYARLRQGVQAVVQSVVFPDGNQLVVVKAGPTQAWLIQLKSKWVNKMQSHTSICAKAYYIAGIRRDFRLK